MCIRSIEREAHRMESTQTNTHKDEINEINIQKQRQSGTKKTGPEDEV